MREHLRFAAAGFQTVYFALRGVVARRRFPPYSGLQAQEKNEWAAAAAWDFYAKIIFGSMRDKTGALSNRSGGGYQGEAGASLSTLYIATTNIVG